MRDICVHADTAEELLATMSTMGLGTDDHGHTLIVHGQVGELPGVYATLRCDPEHVALLENIPAGLAIVEPPEDLPLIGGEWLGPPPPPDLETLRASKAAEIIGGAEAVLAPLAAEYGTTERLTWDQQSVEARALQDDQAADAPLLRAMATARGMDVLELAARVLSNEALWKIISGTIIGQRQALWDRLERATTPADVVAITVTYSLPGA